MTTDQTLYEFVMEKLRSKDIPQRRIASESGVPFSTVCKIAQGSVKEPSVHTVQRLYDYFTKAPEVVRAPHNTPSVAPAVPPGNTETPVFATTPIKEAA